MPQTLRVKAINLVHQGYQGHQGLVKSKKLIHMKTWFPKVDAMMAERIVACIPYQANTPSPRPEPLHMSDTPGYPWQEISAAFYGSFQSVLVMIDRYSQYHVIEVVHPTCANSVTPAFDNVFYAGNSRETDNGTPFNSHQFHTFGKHMGFKHHRITPLWS